MGHEPLRHLLRSLGRLGQAAGAVSDAQLLRRFVASRDQAAFELLVWRHGPMVLGACRRLLADPQDAEDAFQATFLALVRKAQTVSHGEAIGGWLHQVAYRMALRLRMARARRAGLEQPGVEQVAAAPGTEPGAAELRRVLDEEIDRLPARQRHAFVLCCLEGRTGEEAARLLGCRPGTVSSRLTRAREQLRSRLLRRGLAPATGALAVGMGVDALATPVPPDLVGTTLRSAVGAPTAVIVSHVEGVLRAMFINKLKRAAFAIITVGVLIAGGVLARHALQAQPPGQQAPPAPAAQGKVAGKDAKGPVAVAVAKPKSGPLVWTAQLACGVLPYDQVDVFASVPGVLEGITVDLGDRVKKGQILATIDARLLRLEAKLASAALQQAVGQLRELEAGVTAAQAELQAAKAMILQRRAELEGSQVTLVFREKHLERFKQLMTNNAISREEVAEQEERVGTAKAQVGAAKAALAIAEAALEVKQGKIAQTKAAHHSAQAKVEAAEVALEKAQYAVSLTQIAAPFDGIVTRRNSQTGQAVRPGEPGQLPLVTIQRIDVVRVVIGIAQPQVPALEVGAPAELKFGPLPADTFSGVKVSRIGFVVDPETHRMRAEVDVPNPGGHLRPGMNGDAKVQFRLGPADGLRVPVAAIVPHDDGHAVYVVRDAKAHLTQVKLGRTEGFEAQILSGLRPDDLVVTDPSGLSGTAVPVEVNPAPPPKE
jgi:RNA polymerase sigma factor (sigma-70 family)